jgi:hypothetical protein
MPLTQLERLVKPPDDPLHVDRDALVAAESHLRIRLPEDYVALCVRYGTGCFGDPTFYFCVLNVLRPDYPRLADDALELHQHLHAEFPDQYTLEVFSGSQGYLPCGSHVDGGDLGYIVRGKPDQWPVATRSRDCIGFEVWEMSLTTFLFRALTHQIRPQMWRPDFPDPDHCTFVPGAAYHQSVIHRPPGTG